MTTGGTDSAVFLRAFERDAVAACLVMAVVAWTISGGRADVGGGVIAGGVLMGLSYAAIKGGVDAGVQGLGPAAASEGGARRRRAAALAVVKYLTRYALLAVGAYVILTRFHVHPAGLLAGALSPFLGALGQVVRMSRGRPRANRPR